MAETSKNTIVHPALKFAIGLTAGLVAVAIPRLSSDLSTLDSFSTDFYSVWFVASMIVFALLIGLVITIMEYKVPRTPKDTFFSALAIPALVAGSLNTAIETQNTNNLEAEFKQIAQEARALNHIEIEAVPSIDVIHFDELNDQASSSPSLINFNLFSKAYAEDNNQLETGSLPSSPIQQKTQDTFIQRQPVTFAVSLFQFGDKQLAIQKAQQLKSQGISVTVIRLNELRYDILTDSQLMTESQATLQALEYKKQLGITPKILKLK